MNTWKSVVGLSVAAVLGTVLSANASSILFDNGMVVPVAGNTWNMVSPAFQVFDDFVLTSPAVISGFNYQAWEFSDSPYVSTNFSILATLGGSTLNSGSVVATRTSNGLASTFNPGALGFLHEVSGLSIALPAGTYFLGLSAVTSSASRLAIGSGPGSAQTIGSGLFQFSPDPTFGLDPALLRSTDHMAFRVLGDATSADPVPEPATLLLLGAGLVGLRTWRKRRG